MEAEPHTGGATTGRRIGGAEGALVMVRFSACIKIDLFIDLVNIYRRSVSSITAIWVVSRSRKM